MAETMTLDSEMPGVCQVDLEVANFGSGPSVSCQVVSSEKRRPARTWNPGGPCACRGDWIRTSDLLNPIQAVAGPKIARASRFTA